LLDGVERRVMVRRPIHREKQMINGFKMHDSNHTNHLADKSNDALMKDAEWLRRASSGLLPDQTVEMRPCPGGCCFRGVS
jgi:hypothetical protein